jgi:MoaA/NifB/PqqE/SkfB family radical SAM enzyme
MGVKEAMSGKMAGIHELVRSGNVRALPNFIKERFSKRAPVLSWRPQHVSVYITSRCNLACAMCGYQTKSPDGVYRPAPYPDMTLERFRHIMSFFPAARSVTITAEGEPFLNADIFDMIANVKNRLKCRTDSSTNGIAIGALLERILRSGLDILNVSLDGIDAESYARVRGGSKRQFDTIVENIRTLGSLRKKYGHSMVLKTSFITTISNYRTIPRMLEFSAGLGIDHVHFQNGMDFGTGFSNENRPIFEDDTEAVSFIGSIRKPPGITFVQLPTIFRRDGFPRGQACCHYPFRSVGVNTLGDVNPCCYVNTGAAYGNIFTEYDFWNNESYREIRRKLLNGEMPFELCRTCGTYGIKRWI